MLRSGGNNANIIPYNLVLSVDDANPTSDDEGASATMQRKTGCLQAAAVYKPAKSSF